MDETVIKRWCMLCHIKRKYSDERICINGKPIILISNYRPPDVVSFLNRLFIIEANVPLHRYRRRVFIEDTDTNYVL